MIGFAIAVALALGGPVPETGGATAAPPMFHAVAFVNDPLSHGTLGDGLLSLNEAILLHNGQLAFSQLSLTEQGQLSLIPGTGSTTDVTWIDIDGSNTPVITIEQDLAPVTNTVFGLLIKGFSDRPMLDFSGANLTHGMRVLADSISLQDLVFHGGAYGVDVLQTDVSGQAGATLQNVRFEQVAQFGLRVRCATNGGYGRAVLEQCDFDGCPTAIVQDESPAGRTTIFEAHEIDIRGAVTGIDFNAGPVGSGGTARYTLDRVTIAATTRGVRLQRTGAADRWVLVEGSRVRVRAPTCVAIDGSPTAATWAIWQMWDLRAPVGGSALQLGGAATLVQGQLDEVALTGNALIAGGYGASPLLVHNLRCVGGNVQFSTGALGLLVLDESRFVNANVTTLGTAAVTFDGCAFEGGSLAGTAAAPILANACYVANAGAFVQANSPLPAAHLGSMAVLPDDVLLGGMTQFAVDLPAGLAGLFVFGFTAQAPVLGPLPFHVYVDPAAYVILGGVYRFQQAFAWQVPSSPYFVGLDFTVQLLVLPDPGVQAPWLQLPPGGRFVLR